MTISPSYEVMQSIPDREDVEETYLSDLGLLVWEVAENSGWHKPTDDFDSYAAHIAAEVGEFINAYKKYGRKRAVITNVIGYDHVTGEPVLQEPGKPSGVGPELADVVILAAHLAHFLGIDLDFEVREKMAYNATRKRHQDMEFDN